MKLTTQRRRRAVSTVPRGLGADVASPDLLRATGACISAEVLPIAPGFENGPVEVGAFFSRRLLSDNPNPASKTRVSGVSTRSTWVNSTIRFLVFR